jgi:hypothetical protein
MVKDIREDGEGVVDQDGGVWVGAMEGLGVGEQLGVPAGDATCWDLVFDSC